MRARRQLQRSLAVLAIVSATTSVCVTARAAPGDGGVGAAAAVAGGDAEAAAERREFEAALDLLGRDDRAAARRFEALAERDPRGEYADDSLVQAAQLAEERLGHPDHARELYARVVALYPTSRLALRARARAEFLQANLGAGPEALSEYQQILGGFAGRPTSESARRMEALLVAHPDFSLAGQGYLWLASQAARDRRFDEAERRYGDIERRFAGSDTEWLARKGRADADLARGRPLRSLRLYQSVVDASAASGKAATPVVEASRAGVVRAREALYRMVAAYLATLYLGLFVVVSLAVAWPLRARGLPLEVVFYAPIAALFVTGSLPHGRAIIESVALIAVGGAVVLYAAGAASVARRARGPVGIGGQMSRALAIALAVAALAYASMYGCDILDFVVETIKHGPDR